MRFNKLEFQSNEYAAPPISGAFLSDEIFLNKVYERQTGKTSRTKTTNAQTTLHIHSKMSIRNLAFAAPGIIANK